MPVIQVRNLIKKYKDFTALKGISFDVKANEIFGILGPNGAGKTTTLEIIEGLKKQTAGRCIVLGFDNLSQAGEIKKRIGVQLQGSEYLNFLSLAELLTLFASLYKQKADATTLLKKVGLENKAHSTVKELSGGQKQKFTIASALVHQPEILFLDEPTTGLDPQARRNMWQLIKTLNGQGITIVMTTHYMEEAEYLCNRVAILDQGQILKIDHPQQLINEVSKIYRLSFFVDKDLPADSFGGLKSVIKTYIELPKIIVEMQDMEALPTIIQKLQDLGIQYSFVNLKTASLEDVYLQLTGREYQG